MSKNDLDIDWSLTTWEGSRRAQLRRALTLTVRERLQAAEGLAEVARWFEEIRKRGGFRHPFLSATGPPRAEAVQPEAEGRADPDSGAEAGTPGEP